MQQPLYSAEDVQRVFSQSKVRVTPDAVQWLGGLANVPDYHRLRMATKILHLAQIIALHSRKPCNEIDVKVLHKALRSRLGRSMAGTVIATVNEYRARLAKERIA